MRHFEGVKATRKYSLSKEFIESGGVIGYKPIEKRHIAIILVSDLCEDFSVYSKINKREILPLIEHYTTNHLDYKVYFCCYTDDFVNIIRSRFVYGVHIFGHGRIDSVGFENGVVVYREFKSIEPKEFVAQFHCNHGNGQSLGELIGKKYYVPYGMSVIGQHQKEILKLLNGEGWTINEKFK